MKDRLIAAKISIQEKRLMNLMMLDGPRRVYDDLDRMFFKKLAELRKHQEWRQERNTLDITPEQLPKLQS
jgi:DNA transposition AAA+ family ATPase